MAEIGQTDVQGVTHDGSLNLHDTVRFLRDLPEQGVCAGETGVIIDMYAGDADETGYMVEIVCWDGSTKAILDNVCADQIARVAADALTCSPSEYMKSDTETIIFQRLANIEEVQEAQRRAIALLLEHAGIADPTEDFDVPASVGPDHVD